MLVHHRQLLFIITYICAAGVLFLVTAVNKMYPSTTSYLLSLLCITLCVNKYPSAISKKRCYDIILQLSYTE